MHKADRRHDLQTYHDLMHVPWFHWMTSNNSMFIYDIISQAKLDSICICELKL